MSKLALHRMPKILLVEDDPSQRMLMEGSLAGLGMEFTQAGDGIEAIEAFQTNNPLLVLMDIQMPICDGYEACREMRKLPGGDDAAIVMITGLEDVNSIDRAFEAGATDFLTKPINWQVFIHRVRYLLRAQNAFAALHRSRKRLAWAQRVASLGNWELDLATGIVQCSSECMRIVRGDQTQTSITMDQLVTFVHTEDRDLLFNQMRKLIKEKGIIDVDHRVYRTDGVVRTVQQRAQPITDQNGIVVGISGTMQDITERKIVEERIRQLAYIDNLTGLPNRQSFMETFGRILRKSRRREDCVALLYLDLDMFKKVNDTLGHGAGDDLLRIISDRLTRGLQEFVEADSHPLNIELSRIGGDEFVLLVRGTFATDLIDRLATTVLSLLSEPVEIEDRELYITGSIGVAQYPLDGNDPDTLLKHADTAMYHAKHLGRNRYMCYSKAMSAEMMERLSLGSKLKKALENKEFSLHYQPQIRAEDGRVMGVEALLRWNQPALGNIPPDTFIPIAEDTGLIEPIGEWVLHEACRQAAIWRTDLDLDVKVAINLSSVQFQNPHFLKSVCQAMEIHDIKYGFLELEITESVIMQNMEEARRVLLDLGELGVQVSIDDFGTGYSSMSYLKSLPFDTLKIDRSFITDVSSDPDSAAIVRAIIAIAKQLGLRTVAEGVETLAQFTFLKEQECDQIQGYLVGRPMTAEKAGHFLESFSEDGWKLDADGSLADKPSSLVTC